jgi:alkylation response protein AidB-like acyl-CoA dehydrogenase
MDFDYSSRQKELNAATAECRRDIELRSALLERNRGSRATIMTDNLERLGNAGYLSLAMADDPTDYCLAGEALAAVCPSTFAAAMFSAVGCGIPLKLFGRDDQKHKYMLSLQTGDAIGCLACTEAEAGSDIGAIETCAEKVDGKWVINGAKPIVSNAPIADIFLVLARTGSRKDLGPEQGMTLFLVERGAEGLKVRRGVETVGLQGVPTSGVRLVNCAVTDEAVLGRMGSGLQHLRAIRSCLMLSVAVLSVGIGAAVMEESRLYASKRKAFGKPIGLFEGVGAKLATMFTLVDLGRMLVHKAAWSAARDEAEKETLCACAKLFASEAAGRIANLGMQIHGVSGYMKGSRIERYLRDSRFVEIAWDTSEMLRALIAQDTLDKFAAS